MFNSNFPNQLGYFADVPSQATVPRTSITFVSQASLDSGTVATYDLKKRVEAVRNCRKIGKKDMKYNDTMPKMKVDPESYVSTFLYFTALQQISW